MMGLSLTTLLPLLLSMLGRGKPSVELPIKEVIDIIGNLPPLQQDEAVEVIDIKQAQQMLSDLGFDPGPIDGKPGAMTREATRQYQTSRMLEADGLIGQKTWAKLLGEHRTRGTA
jgi:Putative peptidoglycan binding domain